MPQFDPLCQGGAGALRGVTDLSPGCHTKTKSLEVGNSGLLTPFLVGLLGMNLKDDEIASCCQGAQNRLKNEEPVGL